MNFYIGDSIVEICKSILDSALLQDYEKPDEGRHMLQGLLEIIEKATTRELGLVSIGDWKDDPIKNLSYSKGKISLKQK